MSNKRFDPRSFCIATVFENGQKHVVKGKTMDVMSELGYPRNKADKAYKNMEKSFKRDIRGMSDIAGIALMASLCLAYALFVIVIPCMV